jgi:hypothetical protein
VEICGEDNGFPKEFIYLRSVGRCLTKVKQQQEKNLKVKNYRPPTVCRFSPIFSLYIYIRICLLQAFAPEVKFCFSFYNGNKLIKIL